MFCLSVCLCMNKLSRQPTTLGLRSSYQKTWNHTKIKIKHRLFLKRFSYKVMTIFTPHHCHFTTFRRLLLANTYMENWKYNALHLKAITVESQLEIKYSWSSGCYNVECTLTFLAWLSVSNSTYSFHARDWSHKTALWFSY